MPEESAAPVPTLPRLNEPAPGFEANTTHGVKRLGDYRGRWLVLFSHPADFTPVCTTEFIAFSKRFDEFQSLGCDLLGLSVDSNMSHIAWVRAIEDRFGVEIPFPVVEDVSQSVASSYGMIHVGASVTATVRAAFFIDPDGMLRAMVYYPLTTGRSIDEFLRVVRALQTTDRHGVSTPEGWQPGDDVILPPPQTTDAAKRRLEEGYDCVDWWFCKKPLERAREETVAR